MALDPRSTDRSASSFGPGQTPGAFACHLRQGGPSRMFARTLRVLDRMRRAVLVRRPDHALGNVPATVDQLEEVEVWTVPAAPSASPATIGTTTPCAAWFRPSTAPTDLEPVARSQRAARQAARWRGRRRRCSRPPSRPARTESSVGQARRQDDRGAGGEAGVVGRQQPDVGGEQAEAARGQRHAPRPSAPRSAPRRPAASSARPPSACRAPGRPRRGSAPRATANSRW